MPKKTKASKSRKRAGVYCVRVKGSKATARCMRLVPGTKGQVRFAKASACQAKYKKPCKKAEYATHGSRKGR